MITTGGAQKEEIYDPKASQMILNDLVRDRNYEIVVTPFNSQGPGPSSSPTTVYVGEAVPTGNKRQLLISFTVHSKCNNLRVFVFKANRVK